MQQIVTRMLTLFSLVLLLAVAAVGVRLHGWSNEQALVHWPTIPTLFDATQSVTTEEVVAVSTLADDYAAAVLPELTIEAPIRHIASVRKVAPKLPRVEFQRIEKNINILDEVFAPTMNVEGAEGEWRELQGAAPVPEFDSIKVEAVQAAPIESTNLVALADQLVLPTETMIAKTEPKIEAPAPTPAPVAEVVDVVKTSQAKSEDAEPEFFTYESEAEEVVKAPVAEKKVEQVQVAEAEYSLPQDLPTPKETSVSSQSQLPEQDDIITFNYVAPTPSKQLPKAGVQTVAQTSKGVKPVTTQEERKEEQQAEEQHGFMGSQTIAHVVIQPLSVSNQVSKLRHFEMRAQDDVKTTLQDHGTGRVELRETLAGAQSSRSFMLLQRDHVPTHIDIPVAEGRVDIEIPAFETQFLTKFYVQPAQKPLGYFLIELDDKTESVMIDGLKPRETRLTADFKVTKGSDHSYILFSGVEVGNRLMTAVRNDGTRSHRIVHVHEEELTFDPNLYGEGSDVVLTLHEEDLLSRSRRDLVISGDQVNMTFSGVKSQKIATNVHRLRSAPLMLGARHYVTLNHQQEEIFVGVSKSASVDIPSEGLIREVIRKFGLQGHAQACLIQVNLDKAAKSYEVLAESHAQSHVSYGLVLDEDGQFYESLGEKSRRLFIMSENQGGDELAQNAKVNVRLEYQDGSSRSFATFCSPNTYLVEQL